MQQSEYYGYPASREQAPCNERFGEQESFQYHPSTHQPVFVQPDAPSQAGQHFVLQPAYVLQPAQPLTIQPLPEGRFFAALSYSLGWFSGLMCLIFGWNNRFIRFHALQSVLFFGLINAIDIIVFKLTEFEVPIHILRLGPWLVLILLVANAAACVGWMVGIVQAASGKYYQLPLLKHMITPQHTANAPLK